MCAMYVLVKMFSGVLMLDYKGYNIFGRLYYPFDMVYTVC